MEDIDLVGRKIIKVDQFANGYGVWRDLEDQYYYIAPEAEKTDRLDWLYFECQYIIYVYIEGMKS